jgi:hypothetical protein
VGQHLGKVTCDAQRVHHLVTVELVKPGRSGCSAKIRIGLPPAGAGPERVENRLALVILCKLRRGLLRPPPHLAQGVRKDVQGAPSPRQSPV